LQACNCPTFVANNPNIEKTPGRFFSPSSPLLSFFFGVRQLHPCGLIKSAFDIASSIRPSTFIKSAFHVTSSNRPTTATTIKSANRS
jgi:hypothetical protein